MYYRCKDGIRYMISDSPSYGVYQSEQVRLCCGNKHYLPCLSSLSQQKHISCSRCVSNTHFFCQSKSHGHV